MSLVVKSLNTTQKVQYTKKLSKHIRKLYCTLIFFELTFHTNFEKFFKN